MAEDFDTQLSLVAVVLVVVLMAGQVVLLAIHLWLPMAGLADSLLKEPEPFPSGLQPANEGPNRDGGREGAGLSSWQWLAWGLALASLALAGFAGWRLYCGTTERIRWTWVLALAALTSVWGVFGATAIGRNIAMFEGFE